MPDRIKPDIEFIAPTSTYQIAAAQTKPHPFNDTAQHLITGAVAIGIINRFKSIKIKIENSNPFARSLSKLQERIEGILKMDSGLSSL